MSAANSQSAEAFAMDCEGYDENPQATKQCPRCGQVMPAECEPDGCEDFYCPEAK